MGILDAIFSAAFEGDGVNPILGTSTRYKHWVSIEDWKRCIACAKNHGKIWLMSRQPNPEPPLHPNCRCVIESMKTITAGTATVNGTDGADWTLKYNGKLSDYYVTKDEAEKSGWKPSKWLSNFVPGKMITRGRYYNDDGHLPSAAGRIWYEADINYNSGKRNSQRILWSNDGLIFVSYDHYETFYEII